MKVDRTEEVAVVDSPAPGSPSGASLQEANSSWSSRIDWPTLATNYAAVGVLIAFVLAFSITEPSTFPTAQDARGIVASQSVLAILALAAITTLIVGEFDISIAGNLGFAAVLSAKLASDGIPLLLLIGLVLLAGLAVGMINAFLIVRIGVSSFIATLGMSVILAGMGTWVAGGSTIFEGISKNFTDIGTSKIFTVPIGGLYVLIAAMVLWYLFQHTPFGRQMYATGYGRQASLLAGIRVRRMVVIAFLMSGVIAAAAGILNTAAVGSATPEAGASFLLPAFAAAFLGATTIRAGRFNVWGTVLGVFLLAVGITGLQLAGVATFVQDLFNGTALIIAVSLARLGELRRERGQTA
jgi:ribose transport system permease protein